MTKTKFTISIGLLSAAVSMAAQPPVGNETGTQVPQIPQSLNSQTTPADNLNPTTDNINNTVGATTSATTATTNMSRVSPVTTGAAPAVGSTVVPSQNGVATSGSTIVGVPAGSSVVSGTSVLAPPPSQDGDANSDSSSSGNNSSYGAPAMPIQNPTDIELSARVQKELERKFDYYTIYGHNIYSQDGVVTLQGPVRTQVDSDNMEKTVKHLKGVRSVRNYLSVERTVNTK